MKYLLIFLIFISPVSAMESAYPSQPKDSLNPIIQSRILASYIVNDPSLSEIILSQVVHHPRSSWQFADEEISPFIAPLGIEGPVTIFFHSANPSHFKTILSEGFDPNFGGLILNFRKEAKGIEIEIPFFIRNNHAIKNIVIDKIDQCKCTALLIELWINLNQEITSNQIFLIQRIFNEIDSLPNKKFHASPIVDYNTELFALFCGNLFDTLPVSIQNGIRTIGEETTNEEPTCNKALAGKCYQEFVLPKYQKPAYHLNHWNWVAINSDKHGPPELSLPKKEKSTKNWVVTDTKIIQPCIIS